MRPRWRMSLMALSAWQTIPTATEEDTEITQRLMAELRDARDHLPRSNHTWEVSGYYAEELGGG